MLYKAGDTVIIKPDLNLDDEYFMSDNEEYCYATSEMIAHAGEVVTITEADYYGYRISECDSEDDNWLWTDEMLLCPAEDSSVPIASFFDFAGGGNRG